MFALDVLKFKMWLLLIGPPKKRIRKPATHKATIAKQRVESGAARRTKTKSIPEKKFIAQVVCECLDNKKQTEGCPGKIGVERQKEIFDNFYQNMFWTQKTLYIRACVQRTQLKPKDQIYIQ